MGLVVSTIEPRKNAQFVVDWFTSTDVLPPNSELWWVGPAGWLTDRRRLRGVEGRDGRKLRFLGSLPDGELCRLYQTAGWTLYPSLYEGFGLPVLDSLRHGAPALVSGNSALWEFRGTPGVTFLDPCDPKSVDAAYREMMIASGGPSAAVGADGLAGRSIRLGPSRPGGPLGGLGRVARPPGLEVLGRLREPGIGTGIERGRRRGEATMAATASPLRIRAVERPTRPFAFLVSTTACSQNIRVKLGCANYSYTFAVKAIAPALEQLGTWTLVENPESRLPYLAARAEAEGYRPVHLTVQPPHDCYLSPALPNVILPFWEFPEIPNRSFGLDTRQNWVRISRRADLILSPCSLTTEAFHRAGVETPIAEVPIPVSQHYAEVPAWDPSAAHTRDFRHVVWTGGPFDEAPPPDAPRPSFRVRAVRAAKRRLVARYRRHVGRWLSEEARGRLGNLARGAVRRPKAPAGPDLLPSAPLTLSGLVFSSIFNFSDLRKNPEDMLSAFLVAFRDRADATLVLKLNCTPEAEANEVRAVRRLYESMGLRHACRVVVVTDYLDPEAPPRLALRGLGLLREHEPGRGGLHAPARRPRLGPAGRRPGPHGDGRLLRPLRRLRRRLLPRADPLASRPRAPLGDDPPPPPLVRHPRRLPLRRRPPRPPPRPLPGDGPRRPSPRVRVFGAPGRRREGLAEALGKSRSRRVGSSRSEAPTIFVRTSAGWWAFAAARHPPYEMRTIPPMMMAGLQSAP